MLTWLRKLRLMLHAVALVAIVGIAMSARASEIVRDRYVVFSDEAEAGAWLADHRPDLAHSLAPSTDPVLVAKQKLLAKVWAGFAALYPQRTAGLPVPRLILVEKASLDGAVVDAPDAGEIPDMFFITRGAASAPDDEVEGLFGHELTHMLFPEFKNRYFEIKKGEPEPLGFDRQNDPSVEARVQAWTKLTKWVGPFALEEMNGLPLSLVYDGVLANVINQMARVRRANPACAIVMDPMPAWRQQIFGQVISFVDFTIERSSDRLRQLSRLTEEYRADVLRCLNDQGDDFDAFLARALGVDEVVMREQSAHELDVFHTHPSAGEGILAIASEKIVQMRAFASQHDLSRVRVYSYEELADDTSVLVMRKIGVRGAALADFLARAADYYQRGSSLACVAQIQAGRLPGYGFISDPHHSPCYRIEHILRLDRWLSEARTTSGT